jgi:CcmD family protein
MTNQVFVITAYMAIWAGISAYVVALSRRQHSLAQQVRALSEQLGRKED